MHREEKTTGMGGVGGPVLLAKAPALLWIREGLGVQGKKVGSEGSELPIIITDIRVKAGEFFFPLVFFF